MNGSVSHVVHAVPRRLPVVPGVSLVLAGVLLSLTAGTLLADASYHTERLALMPVGGSAGTGMVVNIHPNGPTVFATERYAVRGAEPESTYTVFLIIDASDLDCDFESLSIQMKAELVTNVAGNATSPADFYFTPEGVPSCLRDASFPIHWEVTLDGTVTHISETTTVTLD